MNIKKNAAFTLIELLVVVLIIGILAAIAWPQYEMAVEKARAAEAIAGLRAMRDAQELYYMAHGRYATNKDSLVMQAPQNSKDWTYGIAEDMAFWASRRAEKGKQYFISYRYANWVDRTGGGRIVCGYWDDSQADSAEYAQRICEALGGVQASYRIWDLNK